MSAGGGGCPHASIASNGKCRQCGSVIYTDYIYVAPPDTPWRDAVLDARTVAFLPPDPDQDPRQALAELVEWHSSVALDPKVSERARDLIRETVERACRAMCDGCRMGWPWHHSRTRGCSTHSYPDGYRGLRIAPNKCGADEIRRQFEEVLLG